MNTPPVGYASQAWIVTIGSYLEKDYGYRITYTPTGSIGASKRLVEGKDLIAGNIHEICMRACYDGDSRFYTEFTTPAPNLRSIMAFVDSPVNIIALRKSIPSDVTTFGELLASGKPMRVNAGNPGYTAEIELYMILSVYGLAWKDLEAKGWTMRYAPVTEAAELMKDEQIDLWVVSASIGTPQVVDVTTYRDCVFISIDADKIAALKDEFGFRSFTIPKNTYRGLDVDYVTISTSISFFCKADCPDDVVYNFLDVVVRYYDEWKQVYPQYAGWTLSFGVTVKDCGIPLHPAAELFYKEHGVL
ncbi:MAG: TAXI family TRAP transporter solute-binding subunit [Candidatus Nezhaarchaeota archaeon]|nr:TAXI family TRAP transporter solute-binding subunit [Candidatus Nezhaarchaeota archaeon]